VQNSELYYLAKATDGKGFSDFFKKNYKILLKGGIKLPACASSIQERNETAWNWVKTGLENLNMTGIFIA
jgi:hypothetical protein